MNFYNNHYLIYIDLIRLNVMLTWLTGIMMPDLIVKFKDTKIMVSEMKLVF